MQPDNRTLSRQEQHIQHDRIWGTAGLNHKLFTYIFPLVVHNTHSISYIHFLTCNLSSGWIKFKSRDFFVNSRINEIKLLELCFS